MYSKGDVACDEREDQSTAARKQTCQLSTMAQQVCGKGSHLALEKHENNKFWIDGHNMNSHLLFCCFFQVLRGGASASVKDDAKLEKKEKKEQEQIQSAMHTARWNFVS